jgi:P27 family predicted phage terminase small subunit
MGRRGPPPKPAKLKKLEGTYRKDRDAGGQALEPPPGVPVRPKWLDKEASAEWDRVVPQLVELKVLTGLDGAALERYCVAHSNWVRAQRDVQKNGPVVKTPFGPQKNPNVKLAQDERAAARLLAGELGLSPSARSRVKVPERPPDQDEAEVFFFGGGAQPRVINGGKR